jgi:AcrR family transcriptional regulator
VGGPVAKIRTVVFDGLPLPHRRRASYPVSPTIGPEGARACQEIIEAARQLFAERGYHGTSIQAIAEATGRSDTAFYQYFHGKQEIFRILFEELGHDLLRHFEVMPALTDGPTGQADFRAWLEELGAALRRYSPVFTEWPLYTEDEPAVENPSERYFRRFAAIVESRLVVANTGGVDSRILSIAVIALVHGAHVVLDARAGYTADGHVTPDMPATTLYDTFAHIIYRAVFPVSGPSGTTAGPGAGQPVPAPELSPAAGDGATHIPGLRKAVTGRAAPTIEKVVDAAVEAFERRGIAGTSVNDIIARAGVAHGTFYLYWADRAAIVSTLAHRAAAQVRDHLDALLMVDTVAGLQRWLDEWLLVVERHGTIFHFWTYEMAGCPELWPLSRQLRTYLEAVTGQLGERWSTAPAFDHRSGAVALWTLLTEFPYGAWRRSGVLTREQVLGCQVLLLVRGLLGRGDDIPAV